MGRSGKAGKLICAVLTGVLILSFSSGAMAKEPATPKLTLQEAADRAVDLSLSIKAADLQKDKAWEQRKDAQEQLNYLPTGMINPLIQNAYSALLQTELNYQMKSKDITALQDDIRAQVVEKYCTVLSKESAYGSAEQALKNAQWQYNAALAQLNVGMLPPVSKVAVEASLESARAGVATAQEGLNKAYIDLNALVGYWPQDRPQLVTEIPFENLQADSIDTEVNRAIAANTDVWKALQAITIEREGLNMTIKDYDIAKIDIKVAELTASQAKDELEKQFRLLYHDIMTLEEGIAAGRQGVAASQQGVATAEAMLHVGMATKGDVISAQAALDSAKNQVVSLENSHTTAVSVYRNLTGRDPLPEI